MTQNLQKLNHPPNSLSGLLKQSPLFLYTQQYILNNLQITQKVKLINHIVKDKESTIVMPDLTCAL